MDKPQGARPIPPDKRHAAYESIFGRPGATHHQHAPSPNNYPPYVSPPPPSGPSYQYSPQRLPVGNSARLSHQPSLSNSYSQYPPQFQPGPSRQQFYPPAGPQASLNPHTSYPSYAPQYQGGYGGPFVPPSRARSINSNSNTPELYGSQHVESPNSVASFPAFSPPQAYQPVGYADRPLSHPGGPRDFVPTLQPSTHTQNGRSSQISLPDAPSNFGPSLGHDDESLDFHGSANELETDEGSSELPWARVDSNSNGQKMVSHHTRQPSEPGLSPLHVDTAAASSPDLPPYFPTTSSPESTTDHSAASTTLVGHGDVTSRHSLESARTVAVGRFPSRRDRTDRTVSMSSASSAFRPLLEQTRKGGRPGLTSMIDAGRASPTSIRQTGRRAPVVYPALLSRVAQAFRERVPVSDRVKDGLTYKDTFDGREAVDKIAYIIKTTDRNLALLLGRALDAQKFFHDVTYDHRLRDNPSELYQFRTKLPDSYMTGELADTGSPDADMRLHNQDDNGSPSPSPPTAAARPENGGVPDEAPLPSGVFTLLTDCYSPTCSRDQLCYSIACPRRLEQQARLNLKLQPGLSKQISKESLNDVPDDGSLWIHSVPQEIVNSVSELERKRQEAINEVIYTERDFVRDMEYLRDVWINRLKTEDAIPPERRTDFLAQVFWNVHDIIAVNTRLRDALNRRQKSYAVVDRIGDILLDIVPDFGPFVSYGAHQLYGKYEFEKEKTSNPAFADFVEVAERLPESRKLELNAYLTKPTTRLARYPLLLEAVLKHTPSDSSDKTILPQVVSQIREFLAKVNTESGRTENRFNLLQLDQHLVFKPGDEVNLRLTEEGREMVYKGTLNKRDGEIQVYLFDHALLFAKYVKTKNIEQYKVFRRPIPLELLLVTAPPDENSRDSAHPQQRRSQALVRRPSFEERRNRNMASMVIRGDNNRAVHWINFVHLGRKHYNLMLWATTPISQTKWLEMIYKQQEVMRERSLIFDTVTLSEGFFSGPNKVNCAAPYSGGRRVVYGTDDGVYLSDLREPKQEPVKVLALLDVLQVDVLEDYQLLIVLSERQVVTFPLESLDPLDPMAGLKRAKRISTHTSFFKAGFCLGRVLVCIVKSSPLSSTFKTLEPIDQNIRGRAKPTFKKLLQGGNDTLRLFREFYIPVESTSIHYLKTKLCVGCSRGFEIVDLESLDTQGLLDPNDESLEFVRKRENLRPMAIYRIFNEFLLCYDEFAFYVNKNGRRCRKEFMVHWEGMPTGFALHEPYVLAFEPSFVEIRHIETGLMTQVLQGTNMRLLFADTPPSVVNNAMHPYPQQNAYGYGYNPYAPQLAQHYPEQYPRHPQGVGREEILIVSDDRVLALRPASRGMPQRQQYIADNMSNHSLPRDCK